MGYEELDYQGMIFRPPSEADSILLQVTVGCSHNKCTFCEMYKAKRFAIKKDEVIMADIAKAAKYYKGFRRLFLCDGDALVVPQKRLIPILDEIARKMPWLERIGTYANHKSISMKTPEELVELKNHGLSIAYMGIESGDAVTLENIKKGATPERLIEMGRKIKASGIKLSVTVLNGIGGRDRSMIHAKETGRVLSEMNPDFVGALSLMLTPGTPLYKDHMDGKFPVIDANEMLQELGVMFANTNLTGGLFHANHASNYLPIRAKLPDDKDRILKLINEALAGRVKLKPEYMRAL